MIVFKNSDGFTLIEIILTIAIFGILLTPLMISQGSILSSVSQFSDRANRVCLARNFLHDERHKHARENGKETSASKNIEDPVTVLRYVLKKPSTALEKKFKGVQSETVAIEWTEGVTKKTDQVISFVFKPEEMESKQ